MKTRTDYEPKIVGFLCNWCSYASSDLAGTARLQYPPNLRPLRVMCSGRVDPQFVIRSFLAGFDAVMVLGCHPGDCHYQNGNYFAEKKMRMVENLLDMVGLGRERIYLDWVAAPECGKFAEVVAAYIEKIREVGPVEMNELLKLKLKAAEKTATSERVRTIVAKQYPLETEGNVYGEKLTPEKLTEVLSHTLQETYLEKLIEEALNGKSLSPPEIASKISIALETVTFYLTVMWGHGKIQLAGIRGDYPVFTMS